MKYLGLNYLFISTFPLQWLFTEEIFVQKFFLMFSGTKYVHLWSFDAMLNGVEIVLGTVRFVKSIYI